MCSHATEFGDETEKITDSVLSSSVFVDVHNITTIILSAVGAV